MGRVFSYSFIIFFYLYSIFIYFLFFTLTFFKKLPKLPIMPAKYRENVIFRGDFFKKRLPIYSP